MGNLNGKLNNILFVHISNLVNYFFGNITSNIKYPEDQTAKTQNKMNTLSENYFCQTCKIECSGFSSYQQHLDGKNHKKKISRQNIAQQKDKANISATQPIADNPTNIKNKTSDVDASHDLTDSEFSENELSTEKELINLSKLENQYDFCEICQVPCSGFFPYQQHIQGKRHKKQLAVFEAKRAVNKLKDNEAKSSELASSSVSLSPNFNSNFATNCQIFENQNDVADNSLNVSEIEKKISDIEKQGYGMTYFCKICDVPCSGYFSYEQHLKGDKHRKKRNVYFYQLKKGIGENV